MTRAWREKREKFAAFYVANFVPWKQGDTEDDCVPPPLTAEVLRGWCRHLSDVAGGSNANQDETTIARGRLFAMRQFAHALTIDNETKRVLSLFRARNRTTWADKSKKEKDGDAAGADASRGGGGKDTRADEAEQEIEDLLAHQRSLNVDPERAQDNARCEGFMGAMLASMGRQLPPTEEEETGHEDTDPSYRASAERLQDYGYYEMSERVATMARNEIAKLLPPVEQGGAGSQAGSSQAAAAHVPHEDELPPQFQHVDEDELAEKVREWEKLAAQAKEAGTAPPDPPLNLKQRAVGQAVVPTLCTIRRQKRRFQGMGRKWRQEYAEWLKGEEREGIKHQHLFLLSGAAGTGKTEVIKVLNNVLRDRNIGTLALSAYTGAAVVQLEDAVTLLTLLDLGIKHPYEQRSLDPKLDPKTIEKFKRYVNEDELVVLVIDECSFINATLLHHVDSRLRALLDNDAPFGGLVVLLAGDFHQKPTTNGTAMHDALLEHNGVLMPNEKGEPEKKKKKKKSKKKDFLLTSELGAEAKGLDMFANFQRFSLNITHRFKNDKTHGDNLHEMRNTRSSQPVTDAFLDSLQPIGPSERERFAFATIGVVSNVERAMLNAAQAYAFARLHKCVLVRWRLRLTGLGAQSLSAAHVDELYASEPCLWGYFVHKAPCVITDNIAQGKGLVNGTRGKMHSLVMGKTSTGKDGQRELRALLQRARPGSVVTLSEPPKYINVIPTVIEKFKDLLRPDSLAQDCVVVPIGQDPRTDDFKPTSTFAAMNGIGVPMRRRKKDGTLTKKKTSGLLLHDHSVCLAFAVTDYKLQGASLDELVLSLAPRPKGTSALHKIDLSSVYVLASRVRTRNGLRVLQVDPDGWAHLKALRHAPELEVWEASYDGGEDGFFSVAQATEAAASMAHRMRDEYVERERQRKAKEKAEKQGQKTAMGAEKQGQKTAMGARPGSSKAKATPKTSNVGPKTATKTHPESSTEASTEDTSTESSTEPPKPSKAVATDARDPTTTQKRAPPRSSNTPGAHAREGVWPERRSGLGSFTSAWRHSNTWIRNSCWVDSALRFLHLGQLSIAHTTGRGVCDGYFPPPHEYVPNANQRGPLPNAARVGDSFKAWLEGAQVVSAMDVRDSLLGSAISALNCSRKAVREAILRRQLLKVGETDRRAGLLRARSLKEHTIAAGVSSKMGDTGDVRDALMALLHVGENSGTGVTFDALGGRRAQHCQSCGHVSLRDDVRVHFLARAALERANRDPLQAFALLHNNHSVPMDPSVACTACPALGAQVLQGWCGPQSFADNAPPLLALTWDVQQVVIDHTAAQRLVSESPIRLSPTTRDHAHLEVGVEAGASYRLVALIYFNGGHYVTVGRGSRDAFSESNEWLCWDAMKNGGVGCRLRSAPVGHIGELNAPSLDLSWQGYVPTVALYCREPRDGDVQAPSANNAAPVPNTSSQFEYSSELKRLSSMPITERHLVQQRQQASEARAERLRIYHENEQLRRDGNLDVAHLPNSGTFASIGPVDTSSRLSFRVTRIACANNDTASALRVLTEAMGSHRVAALNFANAHRVGGGYTTGASAQEEDLCRVMPLLHHQLSGLAYPLPATSVHYTTTLLCRSPRDYSIVDPCQVNLLSAAMPNLKNAKEPRAGTIEWCTNVSDRIRAVLRAAQHRDITVLVLGAFGCGAFGNPPDEVARCFVRVLCSPEFAHAFHSIVFAVLEGHSHRKSNLATFEQILQSELCRPIATDVGALAHGACAATADPSAQQMGTHKPLGMTGAGGKRVMVHSPVSARGLSPRRPRQHEAFEIAEHVHAPPDAVRTPRGVLRHEQPGVGQPTGVQEPVVATGNAGGKRVMVRSPGGVSALTPSRQHEHKRAPRLLDMDGQ